MFDYKMFGLCDFFIGYILLRTLLAMETSAFLCRIPQLIGLLCCLTTAFETNLQCSYPLGLALFLLLKGCRDVLPIYVFRSNTLT